MVIQNFPLLNGGVESLLVEEVEISNDKVFHEVYSVNFCCVRVF